MYILLAAQIERRVNRCVWLKHHLLSHWLRVPRLLLHRLAVKHLFWPISSIQINSNVWSNRPGRPGGLLGTGGGGKQALVSASLSSWTPSAAHILPVSDSFAWQHQKWISDSICVPVSRGDVARGEFLVPVMRNQIVIENENKCFNR